ncbi:hypothetical protein K4L06_13440 [Lysobacter sp. BMK333-48F3]|uniref:hypothetical protein n=1 Tax=Lysobacter sp. BMK333-48F3 TaxID=2867962 RepID=UPI001C8C4F98|nr:hypothetical protein [Lysobacter sp. BMK333-48F3]MBX9402312.1 hypothetical protein [Lysobacter sp. BMK333-48F3]
MSSYFIELETESPVFFSDFDEDLFFGWLNKIESIAEVRGEGVFIKINISLERLDEEGFRELIAIFTRFGLNVAELKKLDSDIFLAWLHNPRAYWYEKMFK